MTFVMNFGEMNPMCVSNLSLFDWYWWKKVFSLELQMKVHAKVRNHGEGPY